MSETGNQSSKPNITQILLVILLSLAIFAVVVLIVNLLFGSSGSDSAGGGGADVPGGIPAPPEGVPSVTATTYVNVRSGPGTNYGIFGVAPPGASAEAIGISPDGKWYAISLPQVEGDSAWVSAEFVTASGTDGLPVIQPPPAPEVPSLPQPGAGDPQIVTRDAVNVRSGPSTEYPSYGIMPKGTRAVVVGISEDAAWWVISVPPVQDGIGWVSADWVSASNTEGVPVVPNPPAP